MNFKETRSFVSKYIDVHHKSLNQHPERNAILTHWVLNQDIRPPEMPASVFKKCCKIFSQPDFSVEYGRSGIREDVLPYQTSFDFVYNDIPYPPPKNA